MCCFPQTDKVELSSLRKKSTVTCACMREAAKRMHLRFRKLYRHGKPVYISRVVTVRDLG